MKRIHALQGIIEGARARARERFWKSISDVRRERGAPVDRRICGDYEKRGCSLLLLLGRSSVIPTDYMF